MTRIEMYVYQYGKSNSELSEKNGMLTCNFSILFFYRGHQGRLKRNDGNLFFFVTIENAVSCHNLWDISRHFHSFLTRQYVKRNERVIGDDGKFVHSLTRSIH